MKILTVSKSCWLLTLALFLFGALMPFFAVYDIPSSNNKDDATASVASVFSDKILICTADGFQWISRADLESGKASPTQHSDIKCPLCYVASNGQKSTVLTAEETVVYTASFIHIKNAELQQDAKHSQLIAWRYASRAPPHSTIVS